MREPVYIEESDQIFEEQDWKGFASARLIHEDGRPLHTFRTASVYVFGNRNVFRDCRFVNAAGKGKEVGQAVALYVDGDENVFEDCVIRGHQDTLFLAPLPPEPVEQDGFLGPREFAPRTPRTTYFRDCVIIGGVDYVFGGGTAYFDRCAFVSNEPGYVFAPSTPEDVETGFVCRDCRFMNGMRDNGTPNGGLSSCYIGRPWRQYGAVRLENCRLEDHIVAAGWHDWGKEYAHDTVRFVEIGSTGAGANPGARPAWVHVE